MRTMRRCLLTVVDSIAESQFEVWVANEHALKQAVRVATMLNRSSQRAAVRLLPHLLLLTAVCRCHHPA